MSSIVVTPIERRTLLPGFSDVSATKQLARAKAMHGAMLLVRAEATARISA
jgi:hypothetical protein